MNILQTVIEIEGPAHRKLASPWPGTFVCNRFAQGNLAQGQEGTALSRSGRDLAMTFRSQRATGPAVWDQGQRGQAIAGKTALPEHSLDEDCLSFVMPQQHSKSPEIDEDAD